MKEHRRLHDKSRSGRGHTPNDKKQVSVLRNNFIFLNSECQISIRPSYKGAPQMFEARVSISEWA